MMQERGLLTVTGRGREREYRLSDEVRTAMGRGRATSPAGRSVAPLADHRPAEVQSADHAPPSRTPRWHDLTLHLAEQPGGVSNALLRNASGLGPQGAWRILRQLTLAGRLRRECSAPRQIRYHRT